MRTLVLSLLSLCGAPAFAQELRPFEPRAFAPATSAFGPTDLPAGLYALPVLERDGLELTLTYTTRRFDGLRDGERSLAPGDVLGAPWTEVPVRGARERLEFAFAWAADERLTLGLVLPIEQRMREVEGLSGERFETRTSGLGDVELLATWMPIERGRTSLAVDLGLSTPTGSIDESKATPSSAGVSRQLPYELQLGTGSFGLLPGLTWSTRRERWTLGARARARFPLDTNDRGWKVGPSYEASTFAAFDLSQELAGSVRFAFSRQEEYDGSDSELDPNLDPGHDPARLGRSVADLLIGFAWSPTRGSFSRCRLALEGGMPLWQEVDGPGLAADWTIALGLSVGF